MGVFYTALERIKDKVNRESRNTIKVNAEYGFGPFAFLEIKMFLFFPL